MSQDEFTKLFRYMSKKFDLIEKMLDSKANQADMDRSLGLLDSMAKRQEAYDEEKLVMNHQLNRHDEWVHSLADKIGYKLSA